MLMRLVPACVFAAALASMAWPVTGAALDTGFYVGGHYAKTSKDVPQAHFDNLNQALYNFFEFTPGPVATEFDDAGSSYGFMMGYRLLRNLAFEAAYTDYGKVAYESSSTGAFGEDPGMLDMSLKTRTSGIALSALGALPLTYNWEVYARAGVLFTTNELTIFATNGVGTFGSRISGSSVDYLVGAGLARRFIEIYALRLEAQRIMSAGSDETGKGDIDVLSFGITVRF